MPKEKIKPLNYELSDNIKKHIELLKLENDDLEIQLNEAFGIPAKLINKI